MAQGQPTGSKWASLTFTTLITNYISLQNQVTARVRGVASNISSATPGKFLLLQFMMSQVTQMGESISNLISQVQKVINNAVGNQRSQ